MSVSLGCDHTWATLGQRNVIILNWIDHKYPTLLLFGVISISVLSRSKRHSHICLSADRSPNKFRILSMEELHHHVNFTNNGAYQNRRSQYTGKGQQICSNYEWPTTNSVNHLVLLSLLCFFFKYLPRSKVTFEKNDIVRRWELAGKSSERSQKSSSFEYQYFWLN